MKHLRIYVPRLFVKERAKNTEDIAYNYFGGEKNFERIINATTSSKKTLTPLYIPVCVIPLGGWRKFVLTAGH